MAAVLAVALLLLCGSVQSAQDVTGTVTQVKITEEFSLSSTTPGNDSAAMAPAITSPTEGSGDTHTAVLASQSQEQDAPLVVVDLARADDENLPNMTSTLAPSASEEALPNGFDFKEVEAEAPDSNYPELDTPAPSPSTEEETPNPVAPGPDSAYPAAPGPDSADLDADQEQGTLLADVGGRFPGIDVTKDFTTGTDYGVNPQTFEGGEEGQSYAAFEQDRPDSADLDTDQEQGTLLADVGGSFPGVDVTKDFTTGTDYGVNPQTFEGGEEGQSYAAFEQDRPDQTDSDADQEQGTLLADVGGSFPGVDVTKDFTTGTDYGVNPQTFEGGEEGQTYAAFEQDRPDQTDLDADQEQGTLLADVGGSFPGIDETKDFTTGTDYGVNPQTFGGGQEGDSYAAFEQDRPDQTDSDADQEQGTLLADVGGSFPGVDETKDFTTGTDYGVNNPTGEEDKSAAEAENEGESESYTAGTTGFALRKSRTYERAPQSKGTWKEAKCTFYGGMDAAGTMSGACGYGNLYASGYGTFTAALSSYLFKNGMACGACYEVACSGKGKSCKAGSVLVTVTNFCPPNPGRSADNGGWCNGVNKHFDLSYPAFAKIADPKAGVVPLKYRRVPCKKQGGIRFTLNGNCNFNLVTITNVGGSGVVTEAYMKGDKMDWAPMSRNWGANWQCSRNYCGKGISIKIVTSDKKVSVSRLAGPDWAFGKTYIGQQVY